MVETAYILFVKSSVMSLAHDLCCLLFLPVHIPIFLSIPLSEKLTSLGMVTCRPVIAHLLVSITVHKSPAFFKARIGLGYICSPQK